MQNGDFGRPGPRLDLPGKKIGGGPKAQGVSKSGEFNTLVLSCRLERIPLIVKRNQRNSVVVTIPIHQEPPRPPKSQRLARRMNSS